MAATARATTITRTTASATGPANGIMTLTGINQYEEDFEHLNKLFSAKNVVTFDIGRIACSAGSSSGDNYMSLVKRVTIYEATDGDEEMGNENGETKTYSIKTDAN